MLLGLPLWQNNIVEFAKNITQEKGQKLCLQHIHLQWSICAYANLFCSNAIVVDMNIFL